MTHTPSIEKRRRRKQNEKWIAMQFARPLIEHRGRPGDSQPVFMGDWMRDPRSFHVVQKNRFPFA